MAANFRRVRHEKAIGSGMSRRRFTRNGGQRAFLARNKGGCAARITILNRKLFLTKNNTRDTIRPAGSANTLLPPLSQEALLASSSHKKKAASP